MIVPQSLSGLSQLARLRPINGIPAIITYPNRLILPLAITAGLLG